MIDQPGAEEGGEVRERVRAAYAEAARALGAAPADRHRLAVVEAEDCCGPAPAAKGTGSPTACCSGPVTGPGFGSGLYAGTDSGEVPAEALAASLGCGNPVAVADLRPGERVLDLGSGAGLDVVLSARRVGEAGFAYGLDLTQEMLDLARANAARAGARNVEFLLGTIEDIPLPSESVDVVISNCVVNLAHDKSRVFAEVSRVLRPGGRLGVSDIVAEDGLSESDRAERGTYVGCIAGALSRSEYLAGLAAAGFVDTTVSFTHEVAPGMHAAIVQATKPSPQDDVGE